MRKASLKRDLAYYQGAFISIDQILQHIDDLICESCSYTENKKLFRLRSEVQTMLMHSKRRIKESEEKL